MQAAGGRISLTVDGWTSSNMDSYVGITAHYISVGDSWTLEQDLLGFKLLRGSHSGKRLAKAVFNTCKEMGILKRVRRIGFISTHQGLTLIRFHLNGLDNNRQCLKQRHHAL